MKQKPRNSIEKSKRWSNKFNQITKQKSFKDWNQCWRKRINCLRKRSG